LRSARAEGKAGMTAAPHLRLIQPAADERGYLEIAPRLQRRFLGMADGEPTELAIFCGKSIHVAHALDVENHIRLLREAERLHGYTGAYMLHAPIDRRVLARYEPNKIHRALDRVSDKEVTERRVLFTDIDVERPKGISSTDAELDRARDVADQIEEYLSKELAGDGCIGRGMSGNGFFFLIAIEPRPVMPDETTRIAKFLGLLSRKFGAPGVKVDGSVFNPARLTPAAGSLKAKGSNTTERPHRRVTFCCRPTVKRIPLEEIC
jgi:hypothetical protein